MRLAIGQNISSALYSVLHTGTGNTVLYSNTVALIIGLIFSRVYGGERNLWLLRANFRKFSLLGVRSDDDEW